MQICWLSKIILLLVIFPLETKEIFLRIATVVSIRIKRKMVALIDLMKKVIIIIIVIFIEQN